LFNIKLTFSWFKKAQLILGFFLLGASNAALSQDIIIKGITFDDNILRSLSESRKWHRIVGFSDKNWIDKDQSFFLTDTESFSFYNELHKSLTEFVRFSRDESIFFCNFPSRAIFLAQKLPQLPRFSSTRCEEYNQWSQYGKIDSISFLYVTGYLKNPASFFGHTLLKFNTMRSSRGLGLLDASLNYGARTNNDAALPYVFRGLTGGYSAALDGEKFFRLSAEYQELQKRDIYEYRLELSEFERDLVIAYSFEMARKEFTYYFLSDNCAYRLSTILGLAFESEPIPQLPWAAPIDLLMGVTESGKAKKVIFHPSQTTRTVNAIDKLTSSEKGSLKFLMDSDAINYKGEAYSLNTKLAALESLNYLKSDTFKKGDSASLVKIDNKRRKVLLSLNRNAGHQRDPIIPAGYPHEKNKPTLVSFGLKRVEDADPIASIELRASNFELLDEDRSRTANSEFVFLSPKVSIQNSKVRLDELTVFKVLSLNDSKINIPGDPNFAWGLKIGKFNLSDACYPCSTLSATGTIGKAFRLSDATSVYSLANVSIYQPKQDSGDFSFVAQVGLLTDIGPGKLSVDIERIEFKGENKFDDEQLSLGYKLNVDNSIDFTFRARRGWNYWSLGFEVGRYF